jgi:hypothetical protein
LDTGVDVTVDNALEITCTGALKSSLNPTIAIGAAGTTNLPPGDPAPRPAVTSSSASRLFPPGAVVGRIGPDGAPFLIGPSYQQPRAPANGRLQLAVARVAPGMDLAGEYQVSIKIGK